MDTITVYPDVAGQWRWHKIAGNNVDIVADSGESYSSKEAAKAAADREAEGTDARVIVLDTGTTAEGAAAVAASSAEPDEAA